MTCPYCKTNNTSLAKTCWSCGRELPQQEPEPKPVVHSPGRNGTGGTPQRQQPVNTYNDFWMGFWAGVFGMICATIIDKRQGFWAAFWGTVISGVTYVITVTLCIYNGVVIGVGIGGAVLVMVLLLAVLTRSN